MQVDTNYFGVLVGEAVLGADTFKDVLGSIRDILGCLTSAYEEECLI